MKFLSAPTERTVCHSQADISLEKVSVPTLREMWNTAALMFLAPQMLLRYFAPAGILGEGRYGKVICMKRRPEVTKLGWINTRTRVVDKSTDDCRVVKSNQALEAVAVKVMLNPAKNRQKFLRELRLHAFITQQQQLRSVQIVPLMAVLVDRRLKQVAAVLPLYSGGTLEEKLEIVNSRLSAAEQDRWMQRRWAEGDAVLQWLHEVCGMVHGDAHPGNWYFDRPDGKMYLGDFGEARLRQECCSVKTFLLLASHERISFRYEMLADFGQRRLLGAKLGLLDHQIAKFECEKNEVVE